MEHPAHVSVQDPGTGWHPACPPAFPSLNIKDNRFSEQNFDQRLDSICFSWGPFVAQVGLRLTVLLKMEPWAMSPS